MESTDHHRVVDRRSDPKEEDEKVERFYALIRRIEIERSAARRERKRCRVDEKGGGGGWIPAFKSEDFGDQADIRPPAVEPEIENRQPVASASAGNESNGGDEKVTIDGRVQKEDELDLKLHL